MGPRELGWFFRLAASPEPEQDRFFHTSQGGEEGQVSKGLKRTAGRDERAQHNPGTLNFLAAVASLQQYPPYKFKADLGN